MRLFCKWIGIGCVALVLTGCAGQQAAPSTTTSASPKTKSGWNQVNPFAWNYRGAGYTLRDKYHFKVGNWWVIKPPSQINPVLVVMTRTLGSPPPWPKTLEPVQAVVYRRADVLGDGVVAKETQLVDHQKMVLDLTTGQAALIDLDGQIYPEQVDNRLIHHVRTLVSDPKWMLQERLGFPKKPDMTQTYYRVVFQQADGRTEVRQWAWPADESLPRSLRLLTTAFDVMHRFAHPLSETVNLVK